MSYNKNTIEKLLEYIVLTRKDKDDKYTLNRKRRVKELEKVKGKGEKLLDVIVVSIRYRNESDYKKIGIILVIKIICEHYIFDEKDNLLVEEEKTKENLLGNKELLTYRYIIEDDELDRRFIELEEWLKEEKIVIIEFITQNTMRYFKEILYMKESIHDKYEEPWRNDDLTDRIIEKIVKENRFIRNYSDVEELESSEDEGEFKKVKKLVKRLKGDEDIRTKGKINLMLEKGYELMEIEIDEVIRKVLIDDEIDIQRLRKKLERGELPLKVKEKAILKDKNNDEKERATTITEKWIEKGHVDDLLDDKLVIKLDEQDELVELKDNLEKLGYEISLSEIQMIRDFGVNNRIMITGEFMGKYLEMKELEDKESRREV
ncbi:hypothetical protein RhiirC2_798768 [Rhizophagus irregularis]|uniref:Uncharacterized protein n=1 Tax=Rhizophagus irregularis TaxID=588596 RepID=A0A2N1M5X2_9GLOM|nr:hypothetical protein RhiirC2_798768 [Rhizophagus irregularis]